MLSIGSTHTIANLISSTARIQRSRREGQGLHVDPSPLVASDGADVRAGRARQRRGRHHATGPGAGTSRGRG
ncbi:hypothetical protein, partial [Escherichia coli]|uniref:hypothetical protein n=1 Tax=Escherichia coli TaxID=562 RepID=UPI00215B1E6F